MRASLRILAAASLIATAADAAEMKILTAGAMKAVVLELVPAFEKETGHKAVVDNDTAGGLARRIEGGEAFDLAVITPGVINDLAGKGKVDGASRLNVARVGVGIVVKEGAPAPDVSNVEAFKRALIAAKTVAYIDPASGGSSGIYLTGLFDKLGIAAEIQNYTPYAAAVGKDAKQPEAATAMLKLLAGSAAEPVLKARGMERPPS